MTSPIATADAPNLDPDYAYARQHVVRHGPLPLSKTPTADVLDGDYDTENWVTGPLAAIKLGRELATPQEARPDEFKELSGYARLKAFDAGRDNMGCNDTALDRIADILAELGTVTPLDVTHPKHEHWAIEQVKRIIIQAMVGNKTGDGMAVTARRAADQIIRLLRPLDQHKDFEG